MPSAYEIRFFRDLPFGDHFRGVHRAGSVRRQRHRAVGALVQQSGQAEVRRPGRRPLAAVAEEISAEVLLLFRPVLGEPAGRLPVDRRVPQIVQAFVGNVPFGQQVAHGGFRPVAAEDKAPVKTRTSGRVGQKR